MNRKRSEDEVEKRDAHLLMLKVGTGAGGGTVLSLVEGEKVGTRADGGTVLSLVEGEKVGTGAGGGTVLSLAEAEKVGTGAEVGWILMTVMFLVGISGGGG